MKYNIGSITAAVVQRVGNKSLGDGVLFSSELCPMEEVEDLFKILIKLSFKFDNIKRLNAIDSVEYNPVYRFVTRMFEDESSIIEQANNLARHLYEQSIHPNIKVGEFYVVYFKDCEFEGNIMDAVGLFKSESRETVLKVQMENNALRLLAEQGMSLKNLDKGCIIFNTDKDKGYKLSVVDHTKIGTDAHYWVDNFLHAVDSDDSFHNTIKMADFCSGYVRQLQKEEDALYSAIKAQDTIRLLSEDTTVSFEQIRNIFCDSVEHIEKFNQYVSSFEQENGMIPVDFVPVPKVVKRKSINKQSSLRLGSDFEVKILNPSAMVEKGYDEKNNMRFYKLYY